MPTVFRSADVGHDPNRLKAKRFGSGATPGLDKSVCREHEWSSRKSRKLSRPARGWSACPCFPKRYNSAAEPRKYFVPIFTATPPYRKPLTAANDKLRPGFIPQEVDLCWPVCDTMLDGGREPGSLRCGDGFPNHDYRTPIGSCEPCPFTNNGS